MTNSDLECLVDIAAKLANQVMRSHIPRVLYPAAEKARLSALEMDQVYQKGRPLELMVAAGRTIKRSAEVLVALESAGK